MKDNLVVQGDPSRAQIVKKIGDAVQPSLESILNLDPNARIGFRGSLVDGLKNAEKRGKNGERVAFDGVVATYGGKPYTKPQGYDVDFFVVSENLASRFGRREFFKDITAVDKSLIPTFENLGDILRSDPILKGMKVENPTFRVFTAEELAKKLGSEYYFLLKKK